MWDYEAKFSTHQAVTATAVSENVVKVPAGDIGKGRRMVLQVNGGGYTGAGSIAVEVKTADVAAMTGAVTLATFSIPNAAIIAGGALLTATIPTGAKSYLQLNYSVTGSISGGTISAGLVLEGQSY